MIADPLQNGGLRQIVEKIADNIYFTAFDDDGGCSEELANEVFARFVEGGLEAAEDHIRDHLDLDYAADQLRGEILRRLAHYEDELSELMADDPILAALVAYDLEETVIGAIADRVMEQDTSRPLDAIGRGAEVLVAYVPGLPTDLGIEDQNIQALADPNLPLSIAMLPGPAYRSFFEFINLPKETWLSHVEAVHGVRLDVDNGGNDQLKASDASRLAREWQAADWPVDPSRPSLVELGMVQDIIDNSYELTLPTLFIKVPLRRFIENVDLGRPLTLSPGRKGNVGEFGLHQFIHGAGHVEGVITQPITIQPGKGRWLASEHPKGTLVGMRRTYDPVESHLSPQWEPNKLPPAPSVHEPEIQLGL